MGSIREYTKRDGSTTYHAEVRLKGTSPLRASFRSRVEASEWIASQEAAIRGDLLPSKPVVRHDWTLSELRTLYDLPFSQLLHRAYLTHQQYHDSDEVQLCKLISVKTGGCSEDCKYCAQSSRYKTSVKATPMMEVEEVISQARQAKDDGVTRVCLGAAWRQVRTSTHFERVLSMVEGIRGLGLEVCCTLGMLQDEHLQKLKEAGLYAYNHNLDTSKDHYNEIITTRTYKDRLDTIERVKNAGISVCCGGIVGIGERVDDRLELLRTLASMRPHPESVPINRLEAVDGTPLGGSKKVAVLDLVRAIAIARIIMPKSIVRLSAGRLAMTDAEQALCFFAGANSIFVGDKLLTVDNPDGDSDRKLFASLGLSPRPPFKESYSAHGVGRSDPQFLETRLERAKSDGPLRKLSFRDPDLVDFASNDYLGIGASGDLALEVDREYERLVFEDGIRPNIGATGSRLLTGNQPYVEQLEAKIADFHHAESALLFTSGYSANTGVLSCLAREDDAIILDAQVHASTWDGARLSRAKNYVFRHNDVDSLAKQLKRARAAHREVFVCVESLYSMAGEMAPLEEICDLCKQHQAWVIVDEAHATGMLGEMGRGLTDGIADTSPVLARTFTYGKAMGCLGASVIGSDQLRQYLINHCRTFIYTTAFPLHNMVTIDTLYNKCHELEEERNKLRDLVTYFELQIQATSLPIKATGTAIHIIPVPGVEEAMQLSESLRRDGFDVRPIRWPTVRRGEECLRLCLHAFNTRSEIDRLVTALARSRHQLQIA